MVGVVCSSVWVLASGGAVVATALNVQSPRVVVLKHDRTLYLFDGDQLVRSYPIDLGTSPVGDKTRNGDCKTPEGRFRVMTKNAESSFHRFIGIDYPNRQAVEGGLERGLLSMGQAAKLLGELRDGLLADGTTVLGGGIGIHGARRGTDWTGGCIALSDEHVAELFAVLRPGDEVEILP